jgi:hypothetical protein
LPNDRRRSAPIELHDLVGGDRDPVVGVAVRPGDPDPRLGCAAKADVDRSELPARVAATHGQLPADRPVADPDVEPAADRVSIPGGRIDDPHPEPMADRFRSVDGARADVPPDPDR